MPALEASISTKHTLYLAISQDPEGKRWESGGIFAYRLVLPSGEHRDVVLDERQSVRVSEGEDCHYAAIMHCAHLLPDGAHLEVVSRQEHYHGNAAYPGPLNVSREERRAKGYTNKDGKTPLANRDHLMRMDEELGRRGITTSGRRPGTGDEIAAVARCAEEAKAGLKRLDMLREGIEPPESY
ncbi:MAG: hypothetical protein KL840_18310 [Aquamicrobium sp.]|nr:hypothetical protein [Aquamicrobium sp.]